MNGKTRKSLEILKEATGNLAQAAQAHREIDIGFFWAEFCNGTLSLYHRLVSERLMSQLTTADLQEQEEFDYLDWTTEEWLEKSSRMYEIIASTLVTGDITKFAEAVKEAASFLDTEREAPKVLTVCGLKSERKISTLEMFDDYWHL